MRPLKRVFQKAALSLVFASSAIFAPAQEVDFESVQAEHEARLESAIQRLNTLRSEIKDQQLPLAKRLTESRDETLELRAEFAKRREVQDSKAIDLRELESRVNARRRELDYISRTLFGEYLASYEAALSPGERMPLGSSIRELHLFEESEESTEIEVMRRSLAVVDDSLERVLGVLGGKRYAGEALSPDGVLVSGDFIQAGPTLYFVDSEGGSLGVVEEGVSLRPNVRELDEESEEVLVAFASSASNLLPVDPSLGNALLLEQTEEGLGEHLRKGGIWVYPILFFAALSTVVAVYKFAQIFAIRQPDPLIAHELSRLLRCGKVKEAEALADKQPQPARDMLLGAVRHSDEPVELVEEVMYETMLSVQPRLERFLNVIAVTAATAPLLGLLGTVTGIIKTFKLMNVFGAGDPKPLISGISEALITTELGLVLAIPALIIHALLSRKVAGVLARMEKLSVAFVNSLSRRREVETHG